MDNQDHNQVYPDTPKLADVDLNQNQFVFEGDASKQSFAAFRDVALSSARSRKENFEYQNNSDLLNQMSKSRDNSQTKMTGTGESFRPVKPVQAFCINNENDPSPIRASHIESARGGTTSRSISPGQGTGGQHKT